MQHISKTVSADSYFRDVDTVEDDDSRSVDSTKETYEGSPKFPLKKQAVEQAVAGVLEPSKIQMLPPLPTLQPRPYVSKGTSKLSSNGSLNLNYIIQQHQLRSNPISTTGSVSGNLKGNRAIMMKPGEYSQVLGGLLTPNKQSNQRSSQSSQNNQNNLHSTQLSMVSSANQNLQNRNQLNDNIDLARQYHVYLKKLNDKTMERSNQMALASEAAKAAAMAATKMPRKGKRHSLARTSSTKLIKSVKKAEIDEKLIMLPVNNINEDLPLTDGMNKSHDESVESVRNAVFIHLKDNCDE